MTIPAMVATAYTGISTVHMAATMGTNDIELPVRNGGIFHYRRHGTLSYDKIT